MLRVFHASGEEALALQVGDFTQTTGAGEQPIRQRIRALDLKRYLQGCCGQPRFRQRLLLSDGTILPDDAVLDGPVDLQLILLPLSPSSQEEAAQLCDAALRNDIHTLERLLAKPQDPNLDDHRETPLVFACLSGSMQSVRLLLEAGADTERINADGATALFMASQKGRPEIVRVLLEAAADVDKANRRTTPLQTASLSGHVEVVRLLLDAKADKDKADQLRRSPLSVACYGGHEEVVRLLLEAGADKDWADVSGASPMLMATYRGCAQVIRLLLEAKADKDAADQDGRSPMLVASKKKDMEIVKLLSTGSKDP